MFLAITNTPRNYAWGSTTAIAELLGTNPSGKPESELWLGSHPGSPSVIVDPDAAGGARDLSELPALPFLLKVLAAGSPLSLQAHPTIAQAQAGYARENALGIPLDAPNRNYKDELHKPELIFALSEHFDALCGFRPVAETRILIERLDGLGEPSAELRGWLDRLDDDASLRGVFEWLISRGEGVDALVAEVAERAALDDSELAFATVTRLAQEYPGDPGIAISLVLNCVRLSRGEVLYLPAGNIHAYLDGLGIELMAASDNVLRGGLTPKHVDVPELLSVLDFRALPVPYLEPERPAPDVEVFRPDLPDFVLTRITGEGQAKTTEASIAVVTAGSFEISGAQSRAHLARGEAMYVSADEGDLTFSGSGELFLASGGE